MRFVMINLFLVCLFLFGMGYLAFGHDETETTSESHGPYMGDASREVGFLCLGFPINLI